MIPAIMSKVRVAEPVMPSTPEGRRSLAGVGTAAAGLVTSPGAPCTWSGRSAPPTPLGVTLSKVTAGAVVALVAGEAAGADDGTGPAGAAGGLGPVDAVGSLGPRASGSGPMAPAEPTGPGPFSPLAGSVIRAVGLLDGWVVVVVDGSSGDVAPIVVEVVVAGRVLVEAAACVVVVVEELAPDDLGSGSVVVVVEVGLEVDVDVLDDVCERLRVEVVVSARSFSALVDVVELSRFSLSLSSSLSGSGSAAATTPALTSEGGGSSADRASNPAAARHPAPTRAIPLPSFERQPMHVPG
jgi:hypothetical protein